MRAHVELFAHRRAVVVPAGIGLGRPRFDGVRAVGRRLPRPPGRSIPPASSTPTGC